MEKLRQNASFARAECIQSSRITSNEQLNRYMAQRFKWKFTYMYVVLLFVCEQHVQSKNDTAKWNECVAGAWWRYRIEQKKNEYV